MCVRCYWDVTVPSPSHGQSKGLYVCTDIHHLHLYLFQYLYVEKHELTPILAIPIQYHKVHSNFSLSLFVILTVRNGTHVVLNTAISPVNYQHLLSLLPTAPHSMTPPPHLSNALASSAGALAHESPPVGLPYSSCLGSDPQCRLRSCAEDFPMALLSHAGLHPPHLTHIRACSCAFHTFAHEALLILLRC